ncbi:MAG TPA: hypothetical protein VGJ13_19925 [Pseudonocardiaceae bacterium]
MNRRQEYALAHPLTRADLGLDALAPFTAVDVMPSGNLLRSILAVDR